MSEKQIGLCRFLLTAVLCTPTALAGRQTTPPAQPAAAVATACATPEHRQFDFWLGEWNVVAANGQQAGSSRISRVAGGCGVLEEWTAARGSNGVSINVYDPREDTWSQHWIGGDGMILHLRGALREGAMVLSGERVTPGGKVLDRVRWEPEAEGNVRQIWETSTDGGTTWSTIFDGLYRRSS